MKYLEIYKHLKQELKKYASGDMLPSERVLTQQYQVHRQTIRNVLKLLEKDDLIIKGQQGRFFYFRDEDYQRSSKNSGFFKDIYSSDNSFETKVLSWSLNSKIAYKSMFQTQDPLYCFERVRVKNEKPYVFETSYILSSLFPDLQLYLKDRCSLYAIFEEKYNMQVTHAQDKLTFCSNGSQQTYDILELEDNTSLLMIERRAFIKEKLIGYTCSYLQAEGYFFTLNITNMEGPNTQI